MCEFWHYSDKSRIQNAGRFGVEFKFMNLHSACRECKVGVVEMSRLTICTFKRVQWGGGGSLFNCCCLYTDWAIGECNSNVLLLLQLLTSLIYCECILLVQLYLIPNSNSTLVLCTLKLQMYTLFKAYWNLSNISVSIGYIAIGRGSGETPFPLVVLSSKWSHSDAKWHYQYPLDSTWDQVEACTSSSCWLLRRDTRAKLFIFVTLLPSCGGTKWKYSLSVTQCTENQLCGRMWAFIVVPAKYIQNKEVF